MAKATPLSAYAVLQDSFSADIKGPANQVSLGKVFTSSCRFLNNLKTVDFSSLISGKQYFAFVQGGKISRAVNKRLFTPVPASWDAFCSELAAPELLSMDHETKKIIYSVATSFFCYIDLTKEGDQKTPGTFFEYLIGHLFAWRLGVNPKVRLPVLNLDMQATLPTDFNFDLGPNRAKFHVPVKTWPLLGHTT